MDDALAHLRKLCGLLGSEHDGERATAARKATEFLRTQGLTWQDIRLGSKGGGDGGFLKEMTAALTYANKVLSERLEKLHRENEKLRGELIHRRQTEMVRDPDKELRAEVREALTLDKRTPFMSAGGREFLSSVVRYRQWTDKQREAVLRTLAWVDAHLPSMHANTGDQDQTS